MVHVHIFEIAGIGLVLSIVFLTFNCDVVSGVEFVEKPENVTLNSSWKQFTLNCSVVVATPAGIDWTAVIDGQKKEIFTSQTNVTLPGYSVERPNNRTVNLIINAANFQNSSVAGNYCCRGENGASASTACAYVTVTDVSQSPSTDITKANEVTAAINIATSTDLSTMHSTGSGLTTGAIVGIIFGVIGFIAVVICLVYLWHKNRNGSNGTATTQARTIGKTTPSFQSVADHEANVQLVKN